MRGVISAGSLAALQEFGYGPHLFDAIFGSSAGSINGAYFAASQAPYGTSIYFEDLTGPDFINLRRLVTKRPALDLGYLLGEVSVTSKPLDTNNVCSIWRIMKYLTAKVNTPYAPRSTPGTVLSGQKWPAPRSTREEPFATRTNL
jgi:predicted patatin/cPLA2 family phospholipase